MANDLPHTKSLLAKRRRGEKLTESEQRQLDGYDATQKVKSRPYNKGAYVKFKLDKGVVEATVLNHDDQRNYLVEVATGTQFVVKASTVIDSYLIRDSSLVELDEYVTKAGLYERIVNKEGYIVKFYNSNLEAKRIKGEEIIIPESERLRPGSDWGMFVKQ